MEAYNLAGGEMKNSNFILESERHITIDAKYWKWEDYTLSIRTSTGEAVHTDYNGKYRLWYKGSVISENIDTFEEAVRMAEEHNDRLPIIKRNQENYQLVLEKLKRKYGI
jgi:hypothetical protein